MATSKRAKERARVSAKGRLEKHKGGGFTSYTIDSDLPRFKLKKEGSYKIDIIPFTAGKGNPFADEGEMHYERTFYTHPGIGPENVTVICLKKTFNEKCPVCTDREAMAKDDDADEDIIKSMYPKERQLWLVYDHGDKEAGLQLWDQSYHLFGKLLDKLIKNQDEEDDYDLFADPEDGKTLKLTVTEKQFGGNKFFEVSGIEFKDRVKPIPAEILEHEFCLDDMIRHPSYKDVLAIFQAEPADEDDDDDEDEEPVTQKKPVPKKPVKGKKQVVDEDDDDEDDDDEDEEPVTKKKPVPKKQVVEDDDEDDDEDENEWTEGDICSFEYRGKTLTGRVEKIDTKNELAHVKTKERDKPHILGIDDLLQPVKGKKQVVDEDDDDEDDDEDEDEEPVTKKKPVPKKPVKGKKQVVDDEEWDDLLNDEDVPF